LAIVDSGSPDPEAYYDREVFPNVPLTARAKLRFDSAPKRTLHQTAAVAIRSASEAAARWVLVLEDDIDVCDDFLESVAAWLEQHATSRHRMYAFGASYSPQIRLANNAGRTIWPYHIPQFYGAQALAWAREDAQQLAEWLGDDPSYKGNRDAHHDILLQQWGQGLGLTHFAASVPSFVQHIGTESTLDNDPFVFPWPGSEWSYTEAAPKRCILWVGDAGVSTGFARCTHAVCDEFHTAGWDVHILGLNYFGDPHEHPYKIYPPRQPWDGGHDPYGVSRLPLLVARLEPDVVVLLNDPWNVRGYLEEGLKEAGVQASRVMAWLAVDAKNQPGHELNDLDHVVVWTRFAANELRAGGYTGEPSIVPLGVDHELFCPRPRKGARAICWPCSLPQDAYVVGVVGRNQPRKRIDLSIAYFAEWIKRYQIDNAYLYLHVAPTGEMGCDIKSLVHYYGIHGQVVASVPNAGLGIPQDRLPLLYSSFDVLLTTTQGEGFGLPVLEAMACGVPCIVPEWSGLGDWTEDAALRVPCTSTALSAPTNGAPYTIGGVPDREATIKALQAMYEQADMRELYRKRGLKMAARSEYQW
jgi:glycosyltransferase involved in cell wall biosynthesis